MDWLDWFEGFGFSLLIVGICGGIVFFVVHCFMLGLCNENKKVMFVVDTIMIVLWIVCLFSFHASFKKDERNTSMPTGGSYSSNRDYSSDSDWGNYDYDSDGSINQNEWEDALGDYMNQYSSYIP